MDGIVACETLYPELERLVPERPIRYVPQWYHEFPVNAPQPDRAHEALQEQIEALEARNVDRVIAIYHEPEALAGLQAESVPLQVYVGRDCIDLQLDVLPAGAGEECKQRGTYYLTRGWIDVAVDAYKLYRAYSGELADLEASFLAAKRDDQEMRVSWTKSETIQEAGERSEHIGSDPAALLRTVMDTYQRVVLIDTGLLRPFHEDYAEQFRSFLAETIPRDGTRSVPLEVSGGDLEILETLLTAPESTEGVLTVDPGVPVPEAIDTRNGL